MRAAPRHEHINVASSSQVSSFSVALVQSAGSPTGKAPARQTPAVAICSLACGLPRAGRGAFPQLPMFSPAQCSFLLDHKAVNSLAQQSAQSTRRGGEMPDVLWRCTTRLPKPPLAHLGTPGHTWGAPGRTLGRTLALPTSVELPTLALTVRIRNAPNREATRSGNAASSRATPS